MVFISDEVTKIFEILNMNVKSESDLFSVLVQRDLLLRVDIEQKLAELINSLKGKYKSSKLNCLHQNRDHKQKFPGINLVRQILRCNGYHLKPVIYSRGYCKHSGKKIVDRNFKVVRLPNYNEIKLLSNEEAPIDQLGIGIISDDNTSICKSNLEISENINDNSQCVSESNKIEKIEKIDNVKIIDLDI